MTDSNAPDRRNEKGQEEWYERTRYQILLFAGGIAVFGLVLGLGLDWYIDPRSSTQKKDLVQALGLITAGVAGAVGIFFTWRGQRLAREAQERNQENTLTQLKNAQEQLKLTRKSQEQYQESTRVQLKNAQEELRLTREGQITERFTRAIDQLGSEKLQIRLGGIYSLERIARESEADHWSIMEVLTAYVRQHAPWPRLPEEGQQGEENATLDKKSEEDSRGATETTEVFTSAPDIQAILTVLRRRTRYYGHGEPENLDLRHTNLSEASLTGASLRGANLWKTNLTGAGLSGADLTEADFRQANLRSASFWRANLSGAKFLGADLRGGGDLRAATYLSRTQLDGMKRDRSTQLPLDMPPRRGRES